MLHLMDVHAAGLPPVELDASGPPCLDNHVQRPFQIETTNPGPEKRSPTSFRQEEEDQEGEEPQQRKRRRVTATAGGGAAEEDQEGEEPHQRKRGRVTATAASAEEDQEGEKPPQQKRGRVTATAASAEEDQAGEEPQQKKRRRVTATAGGGGGATAAGDVGESSSSLPSSAEAAASSSSSCSSTTTNNSEGLLNEKVLVQIFQHTKWNPLLVARAACVCKKLRGIAKRLLWKEFCLSRAPRMVSDLIAGDSSHSTYGGWDTIAKLLCYCGGCQPTSNFRIACRIPGHFVKTTRFSKTSGRSFLPPPCRSDVLYVTDACEHGLSAGAGADADADGDEDEVGVFRGVVRGFAASAMMQCLMARGAAFEREKACPYCAARMWSMTSARMVPRSASRRLAAYDGHLEYFVCVNGHLHGKCLLLPLSDDSDEFSDPDPDPVPDAVA